ncbi:putative 2-ketogluconate reductase [Alicyclobacillus acidoterrestris]|uniref:2-hydroxyacid dehydrogenase n=1 Tax=Alicyclobacillus suci TaxID=2816080 RepID=UPI0011952A13|nr:D-glycerate dehydrogenase [Alicyclobacillus suci]GEO24268.1 putative 2-ketogluconate reductase [Alicyclobacillus acidoterrestris]
MHRVFSTRRLPEAAVAYLKNHVELDIWDGAKRPTFEQLVERAQTADGLITSGISIDDALLAKLPNLKCVSTSSVGYDHFDTAAMRRYGVIGTHTPGVLDETVADLTFTLMLAAARRVVEMDAIVRQGKWHGKPESFYFGVDVHHRTLGIIGMGRIGEAVARRAALGFGMDVLYHNRTRKPEVEQRLGLEYTTFEDLLRRADFVVLLTPLTEETRGLMNQAAFDLMKSSAIFVNVSRGLTVDEDALYNALKNGSIRAAGLDVFREEPTPVSNPLLQLDNVVVLPHIGSATQTTRDDMAMLAAKNVVAVLEGRASDAKVISELRDLVKEC